ncbi:MAG: type VI secretion system tube protein Hcp [Dehalococcoidia bacterium]|nr:type VI secretion system tube protein Hcp [Dehalococcoidia bacterium]
MASDYLLELDGIKGESRDRRHPGAIDITSFSWGASYHGSPSGGGGGSGKVVYQDLHFTKKTDSTSSQLFLRCATGTHIKKAVLFVRKSGGDQQEYMKVTMEDILVSSFQSAASSSADTLDEVNLSFSQITFDGASPGGGD